MLNFPCPLAKVASLIGILWKEKKRRMENRPYPFKIPHLKE
jgi:hypothetical protein